MGWSEGFVTSRVRILYPTHNMELITIFENWPNSFGSSYGVWQNKLWFNFLIGLKNVARIYCSGFAILVLLPHYLMHYSAFLYLPAGHLWFFSIPLNQWSLRGLLSSSHFSIQRSFLLSTHSIPIPIAQLLLLFCSNPLPLEDKVYCD